MIHNKKLSVFLIFFSLCFFSLSANAKDSISIGSKRFPESMLLAEMMAQIIENNTNLQVIRKFELGGTSVLFKALNDGNIDLYAEYTGTGWTSILNNDPEHMDEDELYKRVKSEFQDKYKLVWLKPFGFNNTYALAISSKYNINKISQLKGLEKNLKAAFSQEFLERKDGYYGLKDYYKLEFSDVQSLVYKANEKVYSAIEKGDLDLTDAYSTDGSLLNYNLTILEDDQNFFPPYYAAPLLRQEILEKYPFLKTILNELHNEISNKEMLKLNFQLEAVGKNLSDVARHFLEDKNLLKIDDLEVNTTNEEIKINKLLFEHLFLVFMATGLAVLVGLPLSVIFARNNTTAYFFSSFFELLHAIPAFSILAFCIPLLGAGKVPAIIILFLFALFPVVSFSCSAFLEINKRLKESGLSDSNTLARLQFSLAAPKIIAGIRSAAVLSTGAAILTAFAGSGGLGKLFIDGLENNNNLFLFWGALSSSAIAIVIHAFFLFIEKVLEPIEE